MGIAERKAASQFEQNVYPRLKKDILEAAHFEVPIEVDWNSLTVEGYEHLYEEAWTKVYFEPLVKALEAISGDEQGREMLRGTLQRIVIRNVGGHSSGSSMVGLQDGVLTLDHQPVTNVDSVQERQEAIQKALEAAPEDETVDDPLAAFLSWKAHGVGDGHRRPAAHLPPTEGGPSAAPAEDDAVDAQWSQRQRHPARRLEDRREGNVLLVQVPQESGMPYTDVVLVPASTVEAISVHDVPEFGALRRDASETPTLLQVRRRLATLETKLRGATGTSLTVGLAPDVKRPTARELRALGFLAEQAIAVLEGLAGDTVGQDALRKVQRIHLRVDERSSVSLADNTLTLITGRRPVDWSTREELRQAVESAM